MQISFRLFTLALVLIVGTLTTPLAAQKWVKFADEDCNCKIKFPNEPEKTVTEKNEATTYKVVSQVGDQTFFFGYTLHEVNLAGTPNLDQVSLDSFNEELGGKMTNQKNWVIKKKYTGKQATLSLQKQSAVCLYKVIIIGQMQYQLVVISPQSSLDADAAETFFASFKPGKPQK